MILLYALFAYTVCGVITLSVLMIDGLSPKARRMSWLELAKSFALIVALWPLMALVALGVLK